ncbi:MAG: ATP-binding protein [Myxococcota bacterium]
MTVPPSRSVRALAGALGLWAITYAALQFLYVITDRVLFDRLTPEQVPTFLQARDVATALSATAVTMVYLLWRWVPSLRASLNPSSTIPVVGVQGSSHTLVQQRLVEWIVALRWIAVLAVAAVVVVATTGRVRVADEAVFPLWLGVAAFFAFNALVSLFASERMARPTALATQMLVDVFLLGWMLHHAGGMTNPFAGFFVFQSVITAIALEPRDNHVVVGLEAAFIVLLTLVEATGLVPPACVRGLGDVCMVSEGLHLLAAGLGVTATVVACAAFVNTLAGALRQERDGLSSARSALMAEQAKLQSIIDCMADVVIFVDPHGKVLLRNQAAARAWPTQDHGDLRVCHSTAIWNRLLAKLMNCGPHELHPILNLGGRSFEATYARVCDAQGALRGVVMVGRDVTERLQQQAWRMQEERMAVVGKLAASLAHELNNPLGAIALFTQQAIKRIPVEDTLADYLGTVMRNANQCKKIVRDLLEYARQRPPERRDLAVRDLLDDVFRTLECHAQRARVDMRLALDGATDAHMFGDPDQLRQVLVNLGLNAIEAMPDGGMLFIRARARDAQHLSFEVQDTGPGVPESERERIFSAFHTTKAQGTGLGLAVARDIVQAHDGSLVVTDAPEGGALFTVTVPLGAQPKPQEAHT